MGVVRLQVLPFIAIVSASTLTNLVLPGPASLPFNASHHLHPALHSFSIENAFWTAFTGNVTHPSELSRNLFANLRDRTGVPVEVRIGGITADSTFWNSSLDTPLSNYITDDGDLINTTIGPQFWDTFDVLPKDTKIIMNLNLDTGIYQEALKVANATMRGLDSGRVIAMEIGNEPDHYNKYNPQTYANAWKTWSKNLTDALGLPKPFFQIGATAEDPLWPYNTPQGDAMLDCVSALKAGANDEGTVKWCSEHTYQYSVCDPTRAAVATLTNLVNHTRLARYLDLWQPRIEYVREDLGDHSFVIGEYSSVSCSGRNGVSNTFGQALWLLDTTLYAASINISRLYIHQGGPLSAQGDQQLNRGGLSLYDMWYPIVNKNGPIKVFPSYFSYLFIGDAIGPQDQLSPDDLTSLHIGNIWPGRQSNNSGITTELGDTSGGQLVAYAFWDDKVSVEYPVKLALLNLEIYNSTGGTRPETTFDISAYTGGLAGGQKGRMRRLQAPGAELMEGNVTTWAGQTVSYEDGKFVGDLVEEELDGEEVVVKASEAVLVYLTEGDGGDIDDDGAPVPEQHTTGTDTSAGVKARQYPSYP